MQGVTRSSAIPASCRAWPRAAAAPGPSELSRARPQPNEKPPLLAEIGFTGLLLLLLVTLHPFHPPAGNTAGLSAIETVATDIWRQISFTGVFVIACIATIWYRPAALFKAMPLGIMALLGWCLLSAVWSDAGGVVYFDTLSRRGMLAFVTGEDARARGSAILKPLLDHDIAEGGSLLESVRVWLTHNGQFESAAGELGMHRHTLRARIAQAEELLGHSLASFQSRAELWAAILATADVSAAR